MSVPNNQQIDGVYSIVKEHSFIAHFPELTFRISSPWIPKRLHQYSSSFIYVTCFR